MKIGIIGGGIAGFSCARKLKEKISNCQITVIDKRREPFKKYLLSRWLINKAKDSDFFINWQSINSGVEFISSRVEKINLDRRSVYLKEGGVQVFDKIVLATGLEAERLDFKGARKKGVYYLANYLAVRELKETIRRARHILVYTSSISMFGLELVSFLTRLEGKIINLVYNQTLSFIYDKESLSLREYLSLKNIGLYAHTKIEEVLGEGRIKAARLSSNKILASDILLIDSFLKPSLIEIAPFSSAEKEGGLKDILPGYRKVFFVCGDVNSVKERGINFFFLNRLRAQRDASELAGALCR
ncbi:MAG: FAD-dependent oxidoreductase [Candidatus Omnitrophica bacterium]|nr:FAD-dependent oxidoreductase [Candidatus Omnitrophota bacterium]